MLNKSINVAKKPEISSHLMAYDSSLTFIARNFKKLGIDKKKFTSDFIVLLNGDNYKNHNIYETLLIFTNKYLIKINSINYENFRLELSKLSGHRVDLLRHRSVVEAIIKSSSKDDKIHLLAKSLLKALEFQNTISIELLDSMLLPFWEVDSSTLNYDESIALYQSNYDSSSLGMAFINRESNNHINLVWHQANKLEKIFPNRASSELLSMGWIGLRIGLRLYNPNLGFSFSTYACTRISGTIRDHVRTETSVPKRLTTFNRKVAAVEESLTSSLGRVPTLNELANTLNVDISDLSILTRLQIPASIDELTMNSDFRENQLSQLIDNCDPADKAIFSYRSKAIYESIEKLDPIDAKVIRLLIFEGIKPAEVENIIGENSRRIRIRKERALSSIKKDISSWV
jgi:RNA polymerase sigma factor (sigma-70 family)